MRLGHHVHADLESPPLLALHEKLLAAALARFREEEIDTATGFHNLVALQPKASPTSISNSRQLMPSCASLALLCATSVTRSFLIPPCA